MYLKAATLDDLLKRVLGRLVNRTQRVSATKGENLEITGVLLSLTNPLARLSLSENRAKLFSCIGELLWYLAGSRDLKFISYYISHYRKGSDDGKTIHGAYGPRFLAMRGINQFHSIFRLLRKSPSSRRAVIQLFDAEDLRGRRKADIPCTCAMQFLLRNNKLHMITFMRSNDAFRGLTHDIFAFTMIQEMVARTLGFPLGTYRHFVGSLHLYSPDVVAANQYIDEGWQSTNPMPPMPSGDPWAVLPVLLKAEQRIRRGDSVDYRHGDLPSYWADIARLLQVYRCDKLKHSADISAIRSQMASSIYDECIARKQGSKHKPHSQDRSRSTRRAPLQRLH